MKNKYIDLHMHTRYSDGQLTPEQMVELSAQQDLDIISITDHDNIRGYPEAKQAAKDYGISLIPGVEITTPNYHLLAYNFNPEDKTFQNFIEHSRDLQRMRCKLRVEALQDIGIPMTMEKLDKEFPHSRLGKGNMRNILQKDKACRGYMQRNHPDMHSLDAFLYYLGKGGLASDIEPRMGVDPYEAIRTTHEAGGVIGIAHPPKDIKEMRELEILVMQGIDFLEVQPNLKPKYEYQKFEDFARKNNLPISFGSDYHGPTMSRQMLGRKENILTKSMASLLNIAQ